MYKELVFLCCAIAFILVSTTEAKGGRSSGRSSSRSSSGGGGFFSSGSSGKSSSGSGGFFSRSSGSKSSSGSGGFFSSSSGSKSSRGKGVFSSSGSSGIGKSSNIGGKSGSSFSGGWFHGFFHNAPYRYTYRPTHIVYGDSRSSSNTGSYQTPTQEEEVEQKVETSDYAVGYSISKALSSDFFSIFNVVHDVSKYPEKIRNKELMTTTTQSPVTTYDLNYIVTTPYTTTSTIYDLDSIPYFPSYDYPSDAVDSKKDVENNDRIQESVGNLEKVSEVTSTETTITKVEAKSFSPDLGWMNSKNGFGIDKSFQKELAEMQSSIADNGLQVPSTESTTTKVDTTSNSPDDKMDSKKRYGLDDSILKDLEEGSFFATKESIDEMMKRIENSYSSFRLFP